MTETVPADIAAAITKYGIVCATANQVPGSYKAAEAKARAALDAAILHHLCKASEMKAALERIEQGA